MWNKAAVEKLQQNAGLPLQHDIIFGNFGKGRSNAYRETQCFLKFCLHFVCMYYRKGSKDKLPACVLNYAIPSWSVLGTSVELYHWKYLDRPFAFWLKMGSKTKSSYMHINDIVATKRVVQWLHRIEQNCIINQAKTEATEVKESLSIFSKIVDVMKHVVNVEESTVSNKKCTHSELQSGCNDPSELPKMKDSDDPNVIQYKIFWSETGNKRKKEKKAVDSTITEKVPLEFPNTQEWWAKLRDERTKHEKNMLRSMSSKEVDAKAATVASGKTSKLVMEAMIDKLNPESTWQSNDKEWIMTQVELFKKVQNFLQVCRSAKGPLHVKDGHNTQVISLKSFLAPLPLPMSQMRSCSML